MTATTARIVGITMPTTEGIEDADELVIYCAKVSNPSAQSDMINAEKLRDYLVRNAHWSPLEMVDAVIEVITTRDIARQLLRHVSFRFQEFSQRYSDQIEFSEPKRARRQDVKNRQSSIDDLHPSIIAEWNARQQATIGQAEEDYRWALRNGIAKECARVVLPEGLTMSRVYMKGSFRSWFHYCQLREGNGTQLEHVEVAKACRVALSSYSDLF